MPNSLQCHKSSTKRKFYSCVYIKNIRHSSNKNLLTHIKAFSREQKTKLKSRIDGGIIKKRP